MCVSLSLMNYDIGNCVAMVMNALAAEVLEVVFLLCQALTGWLMVS